MRLRKTSIFPSSRDLIFEKLQKLETLQYIAKPYAAFEPLDRDRNIWEEGSTSSYRFKLSGVLPFGTHTIHIIRFDRDEILSHEGNEHVPLWNHHITLKEIDETHTGYTDEVEMKAGWKTIFI